MAARERKVMQWLVQLSRGYQCRVEYRHRVDMCRTVHVSPVVLLARGWPYVCR